MTTSAPLLTFVHEDGKGGAAWGGMEVDDGTTLAKLMAFGDFLKFKAQRTESKNKEESLSGDAKDAEKSDGDSNDGSSSEDESEKTKRGGSRGQYRKYTDDQWKRYFELQINHGKSGAAASLESGIHQRTGNDRYLKHLEDPLQGIPVGLKQHGGGSGRPAKLNKEHTNFIDNYFKDQPDAINDDLVGSPTEQFEGLKVSRSTVYRHVKTECLFSVQRIKTISEARNSDRTKGLREEFANAWQHKQEDFLAKSVFIDEAGFYLHMGQLVGWAKKGKKKPPTKKIPTNKGPNITILGAICAQGVIDISLRIPKIVKKRKIIKKGASTKPEQSRGTNAEHFLTFINDVMDTLDKFELKDFNIVMDNASIRQASDLAKHIAPRGYNAVYLPPYSPFPYLIEEYRVKIKSIFRRQQLEDNETIQMRTAECATQITVEDIQGWIRHSLTFLPRCLTKENDL